MPKVSFATADATILSGFGFQQGRGNVVEAKVKVHQYPPNKATKKQSAPFPCVQLLIHKVDENMELMSVYNTQTRQHEADMGEVELRIGDLKDFHPGNGTGPDDADPADAGQEVDAEGNMIYVKNESAKLTNFNGFFPFLQSLEKEGFQAAVLARGWIPDLVGLVADFNTVPQEGTTRKRDDGTPFTNFIVSKIYTYPYDQAKPKGKGEVPAKPTGKVATAKPTGKSAAPKPSVPAAPKPSPTADDNESIAVAYLAEAVAKFAGETITRSKLQATVQTMAMRAKIPTKEIPAVVAYFKDDEWLAAQVEGAAFLADDEENEGKPSITFLDATE